MIEVRIFKSGYNSERRFGDRTVSERLLIMSPPYPLVSDLYMVSFLVPHALSTPQLHHWQVIQLRQTSIPGELAAWIITGQQQLLVYPRVQY